MISKVYTEIRVQHGKGKIRNWNITLFLIDTLKRKKVLFKSKNVFFNPKTVLITVNILFCLEIVYLLNLSLTHIPLHSLYLNPAPPFEKF